MRRFLVAALAPMLVIAAGCGSSSSNSSSAPSTPAAAPTTSTAAPAAGAHAVAVSETEYKLTPADPSVKSGKVTIVARNNGKVPHAIEVEGGGSGGKDAKSATIAPGQSATLAVDLKAGKTYAWYCPIDGHKGLGMKGSIKVAGSSSSSSQPQTSTGGSNGSSGGGSSGGSGGGY